MPAPKMPDGSTTRTLRILLTSDDFLPAATGVGVHLNLVAPELARRGHQVTVMTSRQAGQDEQADWRGVRVLRMPSLKVLGFRQALPSRRSIARWLSDLMPDVVHHHYAGLMMRRVVAAAAATGLPQVSTYHFGPEVLCAPWPMRPWRRWIRREMLRAHGAASLVICPSAHCMSCLAAMGLGAPMRHISNPVSFGDAQAADSGPQAGPAGDSTRPGAPFVVLYAGRLAAEKNLIYLIRAFAEFAESHPDGALRIAGQGPQEAALRRACVEHAPPHGPLRVEFLGFLDRAALAREYSACDVFVLPSLTEIQPMAAMEAMSFAKPVILTRALGVADELVRHGDSGFIVDPHDPRDLAQRLATLAKFPALRRAMGEVGRGKAGAFGLERAVDALEEAYRSVCA